MKPYYDRDGITIYHGDCREILPELGPVDLILADPPYGIRHRSRNVVETTTAEWMKTEIANDGDTSLRDLILGYSGEWACFGSFKAEPPAQYRGMLIWDKGPATGMGDWTFPWKASFEPIYISGARWCGSRDEGVIKGHHVVSRKSMGRLHANQKPTGLMRYLIRKHDAPCVVDPCMGSGTTLVAAQIEGRKAIGIEVEERYCEIASRRLDQKVFQWSQL